MELVAFVKAKIRRIGPWVGVRWARNQKIPFVVTYVAMFGKLPRQLRTSGTQLAGFGHQ